MSQPAAKQVVIASRLSDGRVVFLDEDEGWTSRIAEAAVAADEKTSGRLMEIAKLAAEAKNEVINPYLIEITDSEGGRYPVVYREAIRAGGPTVQTGP